MSIKSTESIQLGQPIDSPAAHVTMGYPPQTVYPSQVIHNPQIIYTPQVPYQSDGTYTPKYYDDHYTVEYPTQPVLIYTTPVEDESAKSFWERFCCIITSVFCCFILCN